MSEHSGEFRIEFTGIGAAKSGTTWMAQCLSEHPDVCMALGKETNYFIEEHPLSSLPVRGYLRSSHLEEGLEWYQTRFEHYVPGQLRGEFSVAYLGAPETPKMLWDHNPQMKLIAIYRNPVDAIYSAYSQLNRVQPIHDPVEVFVEKYSGMLNYFNYHTNTQRYLEVFDREQMLLLPYEDIRQDAEAVYVQTCRFLGIDESHRPSGLHQRINPSRVVRSRWIRDLRSLVTATFAANNFTRQVRRGLMKSGLGQPLLKIVRLNEKPGQYEPLPPAVRAALSDRFREENEKLAELLQRDLSHWNSPQTPAREAVTA